MALITVLSLILSVGFTLIEADSIESFFVDLKEMNQLNKQLRHDNQALNDTLTQLTQLLEESNELNLELRQDMDSMNASLTMLLNLQNGKALCFLRYLNGDVLINLKVIKGL